jgi:hypothetical protein
MLRMIRKLKRSIPFFISLSSDDPVVMLPLLVYELVVRVTSFVQKTGM